MSWRRIELNSASMPASSRITSAAVTQSRRAKASSVRRSMEIASSAACPSSTGGGCIAPRSWMLFAMRAIFCASSPMRSRSVTVLVIARIMRRSLAAGWRRTITWLQSPSSATSMALTLWSFCITSSISARSPEASASSARRICDSTRPPICSTRERIESRSRSYCLEACSLMPMGLSKPSGDVVLRLLLLRLDEQLVGDAVLDQLAEVHVGGEVRDAGRLLHVVRHDQDGDALLEIVDQLLDQGGGDRVERRGRLIKQEQLGTGRQRPGNAQPLLLPAREVIGRLVDAVLDLVPERRVVQRGLDLLLDAAARVLAAYAKAIGDIVEDRLRKRIRFLEHHADPHAHLDRVDVRCEQIAVVGMQHDASLVAVAGIEIVHAVEAAQEGRLAAARRPDQRGHLALVDRHADGLQCLEVAVVEVEILHLGFRGQRGLLFHKGFGRG